MTLQTIDQIRHQIADQHINLDGAISESIKNIISAMIAKGDSNNARRLSAILDKFECGELYITFSGHFSAGKSSLINELAGHPILPSSPIPTSANVVTIQSGEPGVLLHLVSGEAVELPYSGDLESIRAYAVNGKEVASIDIKYPLYWPETLRLMDTPGIDSTDDAHKLSTESALHLADIVIYTMDYNHVLSELNFHFIKALQDQGKTIVLVINQIDKHQDAELSFASFQDGVEDAFRAWQIQPSDIFYTSLKQLNHPANELEQLKSTIKEWVKRKQSMISESLVQNTLQIIDDHARWIRNSQSEQRTELNEIIDGAESTDWAVQIQALEHQQGQLLKRATELENRGKKEIETIIDNANLTPFHIRELAERFLESLRPNFKVGFLFASAKTEQERHNRLDAFQSEFAKQVSAHLEWHLKQLLIRLQEEEGFNESRYAEAVHNMKVTVDQDLFTKQVQQGALASLSGQYVLQYCQDLAQFIKSLYRKKSLELLEGLVQLVNQELRVQLATIQERLSGLNQVKTATEQLQQLNAELEEQTRELADRLMRHVKMDSEVVSTSARRKDRTSEDGVTKHSYATPAAKYTIQWEKQSVSTDSASNMDQAFKRKLSEAGDSLRQFAEVAQKLPGLQRAASNIRERATRLEQSQFTVALFGAFSAGKSSFANALMGNRVLPVSPNPTTATINQVLPPDEHHPHGTVRVQIKDEATLLADLTHSLKVFELAADNIPSAIEQIERLEPAHWNPSTKPHYSFLKAAKEGYSDVSNYIGEELLVGPDDFQAYVAEERKAAFVESIELYYDCPFTAYGITLVDTPGADSINARHTGVSFNYIKNADAVLFVTYYNHAFSHADRDFLTQLGRVKDTFEMDKMFFVVNAADLAKDQTELQSVVDHVRDNLQAHGIRNARIYPVSSKSALEGKLDQSPDVLTRSGLPAFEQDFFQFTVEELTEVAIASAANEMERVIKQVDQMVESSQRNEDERIQLKQQAIERRTEALHLKPNFDSEKKQVEQEASELLFYVKKRVMDRFNEFFQKAFNPSVISDDAGNVKATLRGCLNELIQSISHELAQEARATTLRMENFIRKSHSRIFDKWTAPLQEIADSPSFELSQPDLASIQTPDFPTELQVEQPNALQKSLSLYKNARHFFELDGRISMRESLEKSISPLVAEYVQRLEEMFTGYYIEQFKEQEQTLEQNIRAQTEAYFDGVIGTLSDEVDTETIQVARENLKQIYQSPTFRYNDI